MGPAALALLLLAATAAAPPSPSGASGASAPAVSPLVAASRAARAASGAPAPKKVWTLDDLEALRKEHPGSMNVVNTAAPGTIAVVSVPASPGGVQDRYREMSEQAAAEIAKLEREKLAGDNPLLRGLGPAKLRSDAEIEAELKKWRDRRDLAMRSSGMADSE